jgi:hypothetical protein
LKGNPMADTSAPASTARQVKSCFDALTDEVLYWRNGVLPFYWSGGYHPGDFQRRTADPLRQCLVWLDARGFNHLSARLQSGFDTVARCVSELDAKYKEHPMPADATESDAIVGDRLLPCYDETIAFVDLIEEIKTATAGNVSLIERLLTGPDDSELLPRELALLEAHLQQPVSFATIQQEKQTTGHSPTEAANNKLKLIRDFNRRLTVKPVESPVIGAERPSPFTIPQPAFQFESAATEERPARSMTVGGMIHNLNVFADYYERATEDINSKSNPFDKRYFAAGRDANVDTMQRDFKSAIAIDRVRAYILGKYGAELTIGTARRFLGNLIRTCNLTTEAAEALTLEEAMDRLDAVSTSTEPKPAVIAEPTATATPKDESSLALLRLFTNGVVDDRISKAKLVLADDKLTVNEKLTKIDALIPLPATASAEQLGEMLGKSKQAVLKSEWWKQNRQGEKENEIGRRRTGHKARAKTYEAPATDRDDD